MDPIKERRQATQTRINAAQIATMGRLMLSDPKQRDALSVEDAATIELLIGVADLAATGTAVTLEVELVARAPSGSVLARTDNVRIVLPVVQLFGSVTVFDITALARTLLDDVNTQYRALGGHKS